MKTKTVKQTRYVCENCGATYSDKFNIWKDDITAREVCKKCTSKVLLADRDVYDCCRIDDVGTKYKLMDKELVKATELDLELDMEDYIRKVVKIRKMYIKSLDKLDKMYLAGEVRRYNIFEGDAE